MIFGGLNSRFWMLRKHLNSMNEEELENSEMYSWECLSLQLKNRDIDIVVRNIEDMNNLLKFLIRNLRTLNGFRGTANGILDKLQE